jgi:hypothetical protein
MGKPHEIIEYKGKRARLYESGIILDDETNKILRPPLTEDGQHYINKDNWREVHKRRDELRRQAVEDAILERTKTTNTAAALRALTGPQVDLAMDKDAGRASTEAYKTLIKWSGHAPEQEKQVTAIQINVSLADNIDDLSGLADVIDADPF